MSFKRLVLFGFLVMISCVGLDLSRAAQAHAFPQIPASVAPYYVRKGIYDRCNIDKWHVVQIQWLSRQGAPSNTSVTVPRGTRVVPLQLNWITFRCRGDNPAVLSGSYQVVDTNPNIGALISKVGDMPYVSRSTTGYRSGPGVPAPNGKFNYVAGSDINTDRDIVIDLIVRGTIHKSGSPAYTCAKVSASDPGGTANYAHDFRNCNSERNRLTIRVNVTDPTNIKCGLTLSDTSPNPGQAFTVRVKATWSGGLVPSRPDYLMGVDGNNGLPQDSDILYSITSNSATSNLYGMRVPAGGGTYTIVGTFRGPGVNATCRTSFTATVPPPPTATPYFEVNGGDVVAGSNFATSATTPCAAAPHIETAGIVGWNNKGTPDYSGAGGRYAAYALGYIQGFVTEQGGTALPTTPTETTELSFANKGYTSAGPNSVNQASGMFGGMFDTAPCVEYWKDRPEVLKAPPSGPVGTWPSGTYSVDADQTLDTSTIPIGKHITLYVQGDVSIIGAGITYAASGPATTRAQLPSFKLIVNGVVYINNTVTTLDGLYAAIPDAGYGEGSVAPNEYGSPQAGTISTCSQGFASFDPTDIDTNGMYATCGKRLTVNGSFAGLQIWLLRTYGSLSAPIGAPKAPAEVFNYLPEMWLSQDSASSSSVLGEEYQSIVGLPPIL